MSGDTLRFFYFPLSLSAFFLTYVPAENVHLIQIESQSLAANRAYYLLIYLLIYLSFVRLMTAFQEIAAKLGTAVGLKRSKFR